MNTLSVFDGRVRKRCGRVGSLATMFNVPSVRHVLGSLSFHTCLLLPLLEDLSAQPSLVLLLLFLPLYTCQVIISSKKVEDFFFSFFFL